MTTKLELKQNTMPSLKLLAAFALLSATVSSAAAAEPTQVGQKCADFSLIDHRGKTHTLNEHAEAKVIVLAFLGAECPLAKLYSVRLQSLSERFADDGVVVLGINSNSQDSLAELAAFVTRHEISFPVLKDAGNRIADRLKATRTPEVFVLDQDRVVRYWGRIDDQYGIGYIRDSVAKPYVEWAVTDLLAGKSPRVASVEPVGCHIGRVQTESGDTTVTYFKHVAPILHEHCVGCHRQGEIAPFALTDPDEVRPWAPMIAEVVSEGRMPPWHATAPSGEVSDSDGSKLEFHEGVTYKNDRRMTNSEINQLIDWAAAAAPLGEPQPLEELPPRKTEWALPRKPDFVAQMRSEPFTVPAEGTVRYQYFRVDPKFTEDKWIRAAEALPGDREVVHHILVIVRPPAKSDSPAAGGGKFLVGYVPGLEPMILRDNRAKFVPAGSQLIFQMHYTPVGETRSDMSKVGFVFAEPDDVQYVVETRSAAHRRIKIAPNESKQYFTATSTIPYENAELMGMMPHMHLRGEAFRYRLIDPKSGVDQVLLDVPAYDFNWQTGYRLKSPIPLEKGQQIFCEAWYDNTKRNLANPDPDATVTWGDQTWDEMLIGYYDVAVPRTEFDSQPEMTRLDRLFARLDTNDDGVIERSEVPKRLEAIFKKVDRDGDGRLVKDDLKLFRQ
ncbi:redoxin domain-containing protein [Stratiformator vulcanicus]|uniref:Thiol-disulfide oxidoreductase n=1 Tax=Stratiformator vulcanicus TaxID=2527980 RepID=A0A517QZR3_9PLAN|nr:redoxin domain-containing protein [Stratiformator vulcanicus]QDT37121.1 thiol-disulfide oxidoreductase [Stratiformator vulcanicus]